MGLDRANPRALSAPATAGQGRDGATGPGLPLGSHTCLPTGTASLPMDGADMHPDTANQDKSNFFVVLGGNALGGEEGRECRAKQQVGWSCAGISPRPGCRTSGSPLPPAALLPLGRLKMLQPLHWRPRKEIPRMFSNCESRNYIFIFFFPFLSLFGLA